MTGAAAHLAILRQIPARALDKFTAGGCPNSAGLVGHNQDTPGLWLGAEYQRSVASWILRSIVRDDLASVEAGWRGVEVAFAHQTPGGDFGRCGADGTPVAALKDLASDTAFWLAYYCQAALVLRESRFASIFAERIVNLQSRVRLAANFIATRAVQALLLERDRATINRVVLDGLAYRLAGELLDDVRLKSISDVFTNYAITRLRWFGYFPENDGWDSSYNGTSLWWIQICNLYAQSTANHVAIATAAQWELSRILPTGQVDVTGNTRTGLGQETYQGAVKDVNYAEVSQALLYYGIQRQLPEYITAGLAVYTFRYGAEAKQ